MRGEEKMETNNTSHATKILGLFAACMIVLLVACCFYCILNHEKTTNKESSTGEVYIINDEVVETGYIYLHSDNNL